MMKPSRARVVSQLVKSAWASALLIGCHKAPAPPAEHGSTQESEEQADPNADAGPVSFVDLSLAAAHGCAVRSDGLVACWGYDSATRVGLRSPGASRLEATALRALPPARAVAVAKRQDCAALERDGQVWCWGSGWSSETYVPIEGVAEVVELASYDSMVCARRADGVVDCWIAGGSPWRAFEDAVDIDIGAGAACKLDDEGQVWCWVWPGPERLTEEVELVAVHPGAARVEVGAYSVCVVEEAGAIACKSLYTKPGPPDPFAGLFGLEAFDWANHHGCGLIDGEVACAGANGWGQLGDGGSRRPRRSAPAARVPLADVAVAVAVAEASTCALRGDAVDCWGRLDFARVEDDGPHTLAVEARALYGDDDFACLTDEAGALRCWGVIDPREIYDYTYPSEIVVELDRDPGGIVGASEPTLVDLGLKPGPIVQLSNGCFLGRGGKLRCVDLGTPNADRHSVSAPPLELDLQVDGVGAVARGHVDCLVVRGRVRCRAESDPGRELEVEGLRRVSALHGHEAEFCAKHDRGALSCFIAYELATGELMVGEALRVEIPAKVASVFGKRRPCALSEQGQLYCWSYDYSFPYLYVRDLQAVAGMPAGEHGFVYRDQPCVLTRDQTVSCWDPETDAIHDLGLTGVVDVVGGRRHLCWLDHDGAVTCKGTNRYGELGKLPGSVVLEPLTIPLDQLAAPAFEQPDTADAPAESLGRDFLHGAELKPLGLDGPKD